MGLSQSTHDGCFLIGSGPSLRDVDVARLAHVETISFNRSYVVWKQWGFTPTMYACLDPVVLEDNLREIRGLIADHPETRFFLHECATTGITEDAPHVSYCSLDPGIDLATDISVLRDYGNVGATSIQLLRLRGFRRIVLVGVDARYKPVTDVVPDDDGFVRVEESENYFCSEYVRGRRLRASPDLELAVGGWPRVAEECAVHAVEVRNASHGSALRCFPEVDFLSAIQWVRHR